METLRLFFLTVLFRPYVFLFLGIYLYAAARKLGPQKAMFFTLIAWAVAYISEFSSVRTGFPFGLYHYIPSTTGKELWIMGVPFMDSLSFTFLSYSSWRMARIFMPQGEKFSWKIIMLGAFLMTLLDVVIDPLALRGDRWFLGKIYYYPTPGPYFGVTIENFVGWFFVGALTMRIWKAVDNHHPRPLSQPSPWPAAFPLPVTGEGNREESIVEESDERSGIDLGPALYFIVLVFNLSMTFWIGEVTLGMTGVILFLPVTTLFLAKVLKNGQNKNLIVTEKNYP
jgi:Carotenoid biosynthesis protein